MPDLTIREIQSQAWHNKVAKGFNITDVPLEFGLLYGEVAEAFDAWRKTPPAVGGELADVLIFLVALAEMTGTDLQDAVQAKLAANGTFILTKTEMGLDAMRPFLNRVTFVLPSGASVSNIQLRYNTQDWWATLPLGLIQYYQTEDANHVNQAGYFILDFQEWGYGDTVLDLSDPKADIYLQMTLAGVTGSPTMVYYVETLGLPFSPNTQG